jgi:hypothetical protein
MNRGCLASCEPPSHEWVTNMYANLLNIVLKQVKYPKRLLLNEKNSCNEGYQF